MLCLESEDVRMVGIWGMPGIGEDEERVKNILDCCGFFPEIGISCLLDKCLVTTTWNEKLQMHDLLQQMGKDIVCEEKKPRKRSRLWNAKDICDILTKEKVAESVEAISLDLSKIRKTELYPSAFEKFDKLRLLKFYNPCSEEIKLHLPKGLKFLSNELRFLYWDQYPLKYLPSKFCPENLVELHMQSSQLKQLGNKDAPCFENLKFMDLSNSKQLIRIPDLSKFPKLEVIILRGCTSLVEVSSSTKYHGKIIDLDLGKCSKLASLPNSICNLKSLKELDFTDCVNLHGLPENLGDLESLVVLRATRSGIKKLPSSINQLKKLNNLDCEGCEGLILPPFTGLARLWRLSLKGCGILEIPSNLGSLGSLVYLHLSGNNFRSIPTSIKQCSMLTSLDLRDCKRLQFLPELPSGLVRLFAENCTSLESVSSSFIQGYMNSCLRMDLSKCIKLDQSACSQLMECLLLKLQSIGQPEEQCLDKEADATNFCWSDLLCIPGSEMPEWMMYKNDNGSSLSFSLTTHSHASDFIKIAFCALVEANCSNFILDGISISCEGRFVTESGDSLEMYSNCPLNLIPKIHYISLWYCAIRFNSKKIRIREASFQFFIPGGEVHKCGVHLMFDHNLEHDNVDDDSKRMSLPVLDYRQAMKQGLFFTQFLVAEDDPEQYPLQRLKERHEFKVVDLNFSLSFLFTLVICLAATSDQTKAQPTQMIFTLMLIYVCMWLLSFNSSLSLHGMPN
ncbi:disease resistance protein RUN1-like [Hevea brasiliensis]|uniref:disease resistance protein RUN1-like n=1 Tax=Hevea brasiliensis TaxID=3981 RepID=UPI0025E3D387|nr:disease resistance protein RUN1-like [Hevea brasiliensis]